MAERARTALAPWPQVALIPGDGASRPAFAGRRDHRSAGATHPLAIWIDALKPGGRLLFPMTVTRGPGAMLLVEASRRRRIQRGVSCALRPFYEFSGARDADIGSRLQQALTRDRGAGVSSRCAAILMRKMKRAGCTATAGASPAARSRQDRRTGDRAVRGCQQPRQIFFSLAGGPGIFLDERILVFGSRWVIRGNRGLCHFRRRRRIVTGQPPVGVCDGPRHSGPLANAPWVNTQRRHYRESRFHLISFCGVPRDRSLRHARCPRPCFPVTQKSGRRYKPGHDGKSTGALTARSRNVRSLRTFTGEPGLNSPDCRRR